MFDVNVALWFNENFVTTDVASDEDLETYLEVGAWTWNWMEPVSFSDFLNVVLSIYCNSLVIIV